MVCAERPQERVMKRLSSHPDAQGQGRQEMGFAHDAHWVDFATNDQMSAGFLFLNPNTRSPAIADPDGQGMCRWRCSSVWRLPGVLDAAPNNNDTDWIAGDYSIALWPATLRDFCKAGDGGGAADMKNLPDCPERFLAPPAIKIGRGNSARSGGPARILRKILGKIL